MFKGTMFNHSDDNYIPYNKSCVKPHLKQIEERTSVRQRQKKENKISSSSKCIHAKNTETKSAGRQKAVWLLQTYNTEVTFQRVK